jgi:hypothetical protein
MSMRGAKDGEYTLCTCVSYLEHWMLVAKIDGYRNLLS